MPAQHQHRLVHAASSMELTLVEVRLAPGAGDAQDRQRPERIELGEGVYASPAVVDGKVYIRGTNHLFCFGPKK